MNLFPGQQWRNGHKEQSCGHGGRGGGRVLDVWRHEHGNLHDHV